METDPELADIKLVGEPWDCGGLYRLADFPARRVGTWNGRFRDDLRRFWKGDEDCCWAMAQRLSGSPDLYGGQPAPAGRSIHFITACASVRCATCWPPCCSPPARRCC